MMWPRLVNRLYKQSFLEYIFIRLCPLEASGSSLASWTEDRIQCHNEQEAHANRFLQAWLNFCPVERTIRHVEVLPYSDLNSAVLCGKTSVWQMCGREITSGEEEGVVQKHEADRKLPTAILSHITEVPVRLFSSFNTMRAWFHTVITLQHCIQTFYFSSSPQMFAINSAGPH